MNLSVLLGSDCKISQFRDEQVKKFEKNIISRNEKYYYRCPIRKKEVELKPEEIIRLLYIRKLEEDYLYPIKEIKVEYPIPMGSEKKRADIVVMRNEKYYIIVEIKRLNCKDGKEQLESYCHATAASFGIWTNGDQIECFHRTSPNRFDSIENIPKATEELSNIINKKFTCEDLEKIQDAETCSLHSLVKEMEDEVLANSGVDSFEEIFKLIFTKLYDEIVGKRDKTPLQFRAEEPFNDLKIKIQDLFDKAKKCYEGIFKEEDKILLSSSLLCACVRKLQNIKVSNNNLTVVDNAFEYLMNKAQKGDKGQYFTPRYIIDMCVRMMNPCSKEHIIDTAAGSSGFTVHSIFYVWKHIREKNGEKNNNLMNYERTSEENEFVRDRVFAIDFDEKAVRVARTLNLIAGDGHTNLLCLNTLDYSLWDEQTKQQEWIDVYNEGFKRLKKLCPGSKKDYSQFSFDLLMGNPPFAGDIKETTILSHYELGKNAKKQTRDILFIERNLNFLKDGGRMAIVLPQGMFNNSTNKKIREFIVAKCRILAVVGLHKNVFIPHAKCKTSVLFVQKWDNRLCPKKEDYPIFFATMQKPSKDRSGHEIYVKDSKTHKSLLDTHKHSIVDHDLYNHDGLTQDGIAEAFIEFAKKEKFSFF